MQGARIEFPPCIALLDAPGLAQELSRDDVHVWGCSLEGDAECVARAARVLADAERQRAERFRDELHRTRYILAHAALRAVLARYCDTRPAELEIAQSPGGKPALVHPLAVQFNLAHAHDRALIAVARQRAVGVDLEHASAARDAHAVADLYLHPRERTALQSMPGEAAHRCFLRYWVAKEALVKGDGSGVSLGLDSFALEVHLDVATIDTRGCAHLAPDWRIQFLSIGDEWQGAVAARGNSWRVSDGWSRSTAPCLSNGAHRQ